MDHATLATRPFHQLKPVQLIARGFFICLLVVPVVLNVPKVIHYAHATDWSIVEDCDGNGFDDTTNIAVPWAGFDGTRGDTPAGPGTADWWVKQNAGASADSGSSGGGSSDSGSGSSGSGGGSGSGTSSGGSTKKSNTAASGSGSGSGKVVKTTTVVTPAGAAPVAAVATAAPAPAVATTAVAPPVSAAATSSTESSASAEGTGAAAVAGTSGGSGIGSGANSLWAALTVGFTGQNKELLAGLGLLAALAVAGGLALGFGVAQDAGSYAQLRRSELRGAEASAPEIA
jgi:hypothetical protein